MFKLVAIFFHQCSGGTECHIVIALSSVRSMEESLDTSAGRIT